MSQPIEYLIAIGSNLGDRQEILNQSLTMIEARCGTITARSSFYKTQPIGAADREFLNGAVIVVSALNPSDLMTALLEVERALGRTREIHWGNRTIDLDLLLARQSLAKASQVQAVPVNLTSPHLTIPHPRMLDRDFVLVPAAEIAPMWLHPSTGRALQEECANRFPDGLKRECLGGKNDSPSHM